MKRQVTVGCLQFVLSLHFKKRNIIHATSFLFLMVLYSNRLCMHACILIQEFQNIVRIMAVSNNKLMGLKVSLDDEIFI
jgi:hypothetical protein